jgi:hypothetical protein
LCVFCALPVFILCNKNATKVRQTDTLTNPQQSGYQQKALNKSKKPVGVYEHPRAGIKEKQQKGSVFIPTSASYSKFSVYFSEWFLCPGGSYAPVNIYGTIRYIRYNKRLNSRCLVSVVWCQLWEVIARGLAYLSCIEDFLNCPCSHHVPTTLAKPCNQKSGENLWYQLHLFIYFCPPFCYFHL